MPRCSIMLDNEKIRESFFSEQILTVFAELNFINLVQGQITFKSAARNDLVNSKTYCAMKAEYLEKTMLLKNLMDITALKISENWQ